MDILKMNISNADGHAKYAHNGSPYTPIGQTDNQGHLIGYATDPVDGPAGCMYPVALSPLRTQ